MAIFEKSCWLSERNFPFFFFFFFFFLLKIHNFSNNFPQPSPFPKTNPLQTPPPNTPKTTSRLRLRSYVVSVLISLISDTWLLTSCQMIFFNFSHGLFALPSCVACSQGVNNMIGSIFHFLLSNYGQPFPKRLFFLLFVFVCVCVCVCLCCYPNEFDSFHFVLF